MQIAYVDSAVWIAQSEGTEAYQQIIDKKLTSLENEGWLFAFFDLVTLEVLLKPNRQKQKDLIDSYAEAFAQALQLTSFEDVFKNASGIAQTDNLKAMDAIHVRIAVKHQCELFITTDPDFLNLKSPPFTGSI